MSRSVVDGVIYVIVVDAKSKWIEVLSMSSTTTAATVREFCYLFSVHAHATTSSSCACFGIAIKKNYKNKKHSSSILSTNSAYVYVCMLDFI